MSENLDLKIRAEMRKRRMTFKELAALIGISGAYLSDILNGNRDGKKAQKYWTSDRGVGDDKTKQTRFCKKIQLFSIYLSTSNVGTKKYSNFLSGV